MKTKLLSELKTKFEGVEDNILERVATKLAKTVTTEEGVKTAIEGVTFQTILSSYGDSRANEAQESAVKNYEKKHHLKDGKAIKPATEEGGDEDKEMPAWFKEYKQSQDAKWAEMDANAEKRAKENATAERAKLIATTAKELGIPEYLMKHISLAEDADIKAELTTLKQDLVTNNLVPEHSGGFSGSEEGAIKAEADAFADSLPDKV